ncbi:WXG100 family type VII secretion target [Streptomyces tropicalis]|uniref:ESAT-6-like protein n=1 Tax=Streptomyces tropicalis TaxID=3034234 RepID=A0ABT6ADZ0_9ACTN|nr:WXG100 family type VII secretion target [Streptomyces tropicalis]MDF3302673.1 WXG100 family type VII secretion target [Streptomyces tropicalis]
MSTNADGLSVKYDALDLTATHIGNEAKNLEQDLQELRQMVVRSQQYWEGDAQSTFTTELAKWDKEATHIHTALTTIGHTVHTAGGTYMEGDKKAAGYFR